MKQSQKTTLGTALVSIWTPQEIIVATDSKAVSHDNGIYTIETACKIHKADSNTFFAVTGILSEDKVGFDAIPLIRQACQTPGTLKDIDIIRVTKDGAEWVQQKDSCPDIKK
jgi:hypothetical protein